MTHELVESFLEVVRLQSVSAAAQALYVSQSTVSHRLQVLESELGVKLFFRQRGFKQIALTESGKRFIPLASQWLELDGTIHQSLSNAPQGKLVLGSMDSLNQYLLNNIIKNIKLRMPKLNLEVVSFHSAEIYSRISSGYIDVAFAFQPVHYNIDATPVFREPMYMIAPKNSIYPKGAIHPLQLKKKDQVFFQWNPQYRDWNNEWWSVNEAPYVKVDSTAMLSTFMCDSARWAVCPATVAESLKSQGLIEIHPFEIKPPDRICYLLQKSNTAGFLTEAADTFIKHFYELLDEHPWKYTKESDII